MSSARSALTTGISELGWQLIYYYHQNKHRILRALIHMPGVHQYTCPTSLIRHLLVRQIHCYAKNSRNEWNPIILLLVRWAARDVATSVNCFDWSLDGQQRRSITNPRNESKYFVRRQFMAERCNSWNIMARIFLNFINNFSTPSVSGTYCWCTVLFIIAQLLKVGQIVSQDFSALRAESCLMAWSFGVKLSNGQHQSLNVPQDFTISCQRWQFFNSNLW
jgi:hypothetical protein